VSAAALVAAYVRAISFTPVEAFQGPAQKIIYIHIPAAVLALYVALPLMAVASGLFLWLGDPRLDRLAESAAEVGLLFTTVVLVTGPIMARPIWGAWWTWDARLTSTLFLWLILLGYLVMRDAVENDSLRARYAAVLAILAVLLVPFIHLSVYLYRTAHPRPIFLKPSAPSAPPEMLATILIATGATLLLFVALLRARYLLATAEAESTSRSDPEGSV
jgi:heme exporter protein C